MNNMTVCNKFQPKIHEGQLCYTLDLGRMVKTAEYPTQSGKLYGLRLLLDSNPFQLSPANMNDEGKDFKIIIHTLAQFSTIGSGFYGMSALKKMTGTTSFKDLRDDKKKCRVHNREECQSQKYLEKVLEKCTCIPWPLQTNEVKEKND